MWSKAVGESGVAVWDLEGTKRVNLGTTAGPAAMVTVNDSGGRSRILLGTTDDGEPVMGILNEKGESVWDYTVAKWKQPGPTAPTALTAIAIYPNGTRMGIQVNAENEDDAVRLAEKQLRAVDSTIDLQKIEWKVVQTGSTEEIRELNMVGPPRRD